MSEKGEFDKVYLMDEWMDGWMVVWMDGWMERWRNGWVEGWMYAWMGVSINGFMIECVD